GLQTIEVAVRCQHDRTAGVLRREGEEAPETLAELAVHGTFRTAGRAFAAGEKGFELVPVTLVALWAVRWLVTGERPHCLALPSGAVVLLGVLAPLLGWLFARKEEPAAAPPDRPPGTPA